MRPVYRVRQFGEYLGARLGPAQMHLAERRLGPALARLFHRMTQAEQAHAYRVMAAIESRGVTEPDVLVAALLHDVGKSRSPLRLWGRAAVVLGRKFAPALAERWGRDGASANGLRRAFLTAWQHAAWGAEMAERAGATARTVTLIRRHQTPPPTPPRSEEDRLLAALRQADEEN